MNADPHFESFRTATIGHDLRLHTPHGEVSLRYADWTASGRLYGPIEKRITEVFGPFVANTHSEMSATGRAMTQAYHEAHRLLKAHIHAGPKDVILTTGTGMTGAVNKFQRILGLKAPQSLRRRIHIEERDRPVIFVTHMEHHSNQTSWMETIANVEVIPPDDQGLVDKEAFASLLEQYKDRSTKIGAFTACSNVTGIATPYHDLARMMHKAGGQAFVDFAASTPYVDIDMHPEDTDARLDAVLFSPHKFLGGPGSSGVLIFNSGLYANTVPDESGGGTVAWTNPWGGYAFLDDIEVVEDAGTLGFLQAIRAALAIRLKELMGVQAMAEREKVITARVMTALEAIPGLHLLARTHRERLPIFSFYAQGLHYNLLVRLLNDRFGVQARGGCSCAGTYGHYLLHVDPHRSQAITQRIAKGDLSEKPGWVRISFHPTNTDEEIDQVCEAAAACVAHGLEWGEDYSYDPNANAFTHLTAETISDPDQAAWFGIA